MLATLATTPQPYPASAGSMLVTLIALAVGGFILVFGLALLLTLRRGRARRLEAESRRAPTDTDVDPWAEAGSRTPTPPHDVANDETKFGQRWDGPPDVDIERN